MTRRVLILAGAAEARALAARLGERRDIDAIASLAGVTENPARYAVPTRVGGFGGAEALADWLRAERIHAVIDATHPYAANITRNALAATAAAGVPYARLERPAWTPEPGERWIEAADLAIAAALPSPGARVFLALGRGGLNAFAERDDLDIAARMVEPPETAPPPHMRVILARPPFTEDEETALLRELRVDWLVAKNAGGASGRAKLDAARRLGLKTVMIARPVLAPPPRPSLPTIEAILDWLDQRMETTP